VIVSPVLKVTESSFLLRAELDSHGMTGVVNSEQFIPHPPHSDERFALRNLVAFLSISFRFLQSPMSKDCTGFFLEEFSG
jgi:hypothetical protein